MKKFLLSFLVAILLVPTVVIIADEQVIENYTSLPLDAILLSEDSEVFTYALDDNLRALYLGRFESRVYYSKTSGVLVEYSLKCGKCQISSVIGTATVRDYWDYEYITIPANSIKTPSMASLIAFLRNKDNMQSVA